MVESAMYIKLTGSRRKELKYSTKVGSFR